MHALNDLSMTRGKLSRSGVSTTLRSSLALSHGMGKCPRGSHPRPSAESRKRHRQCEHAKSVKAAKRRVAKGRHGPPECRMPRECRLINGRLAGRSSESAVEIQASHWLPSWQVLSQPQRRQWRVCLLCHLLQLQLAPRVL